MFVRHPVRNTISAGLLVLALANAGGLPAAVAAEAKDANLVSRFMLGEEEDAKLPFLFEADELRYLESTDTVIGQGNVRISRQGRILTADWVEYRRTDKILVAVGNVVLVEVTDEVLFADEVELTENLDQGYASNPRILMADGTRVAATGAARLSEDRVVVQRAVYSPCQLCSSDPDAAPLWQIRAEKITHSEVRQEIEFEDARLDVFGVPVAYVPFYSQPDPRVEKKTGFLTPTFGHDEGLGFTLKAPFFWNIAPNRDLTVTPLVTTEEWPVLIGDYRHLFSFGKTEVEASTGYLERVEDGMIEGRSSRGHIRWTGEAALTEHWRSNFQLYRASDNTYLRTFQLDDAGTLRSFATAEGFYRHLYINATTFSVQEQRTNFDEEDTLIALPYATVDYDAPLGFGGIQAHGRLGAHVLFLPDGADTRHLATEFRLSRRWSWSGQLVAVETSLRGDVWHTGQLVSGVEPGVGLRLIPRITADWAYPLFRPIGSATLTLTPRAMSTFATRGLNTDELPNKDSQSLEFDTAALFRPTLAAGRDRIDDGTRIDYGLEAALNLSDSQLTATVGQSFRDGSSREFGDGTGLQDQYSDLTTGFRIETGGWLDAYSHLRWDMSESSVNAAENGLRLRQEPLQLSLTHTYLPKREFDDVTLTEVHQVNVGIRLALSDHWAVSAAHIHDLDRSESLRTSAGISYGDECTLFELAVTRDFTETPEVGPNDSIFFRLVLRHFAESEAQRGLALE